MAALYQRYVYAVALAVLTTPSLLTRWRLAMTRTAVFRLSAGMAAVYLAYFAVDPPEVPETMSALRTDLAFVVAQGLLLWQVVALYWKTSSGRPLPWLSLVGTATLFCLGDITTQGPLADLYQASALTFTLVVGLYASSFRDFAAPLPGRHWLPRTIALGTIVALLTGAGWVTAQALQEHERDLERVLTRLFADQTTVETGFSGTGRLDSITRTQSQSDDTIALRVFSEGGAPPTYWRGQVFEQFRWSQWSPSPRKEILPFFPVMTRLMDLPEGQRLFPLTDRVAFTSDLTRYECHPAESSELRCFAPLATQWVATEADTLSFHDHGVAYKRSQQAPSSYAVYVGGAPAFRSLNDSERERLMRTPRLDEDVYQLAEDLFRDCATSAEKIRAVEEYFRKNYEYASEIIVPPQQEPISFFLLEQPPAHCEYFATGAAILLRLGRVPCRYVTGYLVSEPHAYGDSWIARNRHAHAWVEALDVESDTWRIVETTPADGRPGAERISIWRRFLEYFDALYADMQADLRAGQLLAAVSRFLSQWFALPIVASIVLAGWLAYRWHRRPTTARNRNDDPPTRACRQLLRRLESRLQRYRIRRAPDETLSQFSNRLLAHDTPQLHKAAEWIHAYVRIRYRARVHPQDVEQLAQAFTRIWR